MSPLTLNFRKHGTLVARILMGGFFLLAGLNKLQGVEGTAGYIESVGLPLPLLIAWLTILVEVVLGAALIVGYKTSKATLGLLIFVVLATFIFHEFMDMDFMKNLGIMAGLLYMVGYGPGDGWSIASKKVSPAPVPDEPKVGDSFNV